MEPIIVPRSIFSVIVTIAVALALSGCSLPVLRQSQAPAPQASPAATLAATSAEQAPGGPAVEVYQRNAASVVSVNSLAVLRTFQGLTEIPRGVGSGFVLDDQGHIVTNNHVIENAEQLTVTFADPNRSVVPATLVGRDPDNDLAVVRVDPNTTTDGGQAVRDLLRPVQLGDSDRVTIGEPAVAMGAPLGLEQTVTAGIVSALRSPGDEPSQGLELLGGAVQTDAAINPGNSGGPLFNARGEVIGVNTAILSRTGGSMGLGFAIPVNVVKRVAPELIQHGCYRHPLVGVTALPLGRLGQAAKRELGVSTSQSGLLVQDVSAGAAEAGIRAGDRVVSLGIEQVRAGGDIIVAVDGRPVATTGDLRAHIENTKRPGDSVTLTVLRNGDRQDVFVVLSERRSQVCPDGGA
jgi:S1-C subfamily serine protease